jgi:hypothetical protein
MIQLQPGGFLEAFVDGFEKDLVGTVGVQIVDGDDNVIVARTTLNITEIAEIGDFSRYGWQTLAPMTSGQYLIVWDDGSDNSTSEELIVDPTTSVAPTTPCGQWITGDDVAECCNVEASSSSLFDVVALQASDLLFALSGRQFTGECGPRTVRPPCDSCWCGYQILSRGHIIGPWDYGYPLNLCASCLIACAPSMVKLAGYPLREITQVLVGGVALSSDEYGILNDRYLYRKNDARWPISQDLTLPDTEEGTWSVSYTYGADPPALGIAAAAQIACELYKQCEGATCALPTGVTRITRQGITIDRLAFTSWSYREGRWATGLALVDAFLATVNPVGLIRRPVLWAPGKRQYAQEWN